MLISTGAVGILSVIVTENENTYGMKPHVKAVNGCRSNDVNQIE
jgi:hypothetical protein